MREELIISILFAHWFCDFVLQTRWMAENKSSNPVAMGAHIATYTYMMWVCSLFISEKVNMTGCFWFAGVNGLLHFVTDYITSNITKYAYQNKKMHLFWSTIGFDQFVHITCLVLTARMFLA